MRTPRRLSAPWLRKIGTAGTTVPDAATGPMLSMLTAIAELIALDILTTAALAAAKFLGATLIALPTAAVMLLTKMVRRGRKRNGNR